MAPGWYGMAHVKWLTDILASTERFDGIQHDEYRYRLSDADPGEPVTRMRVRSLMTPPGIPENLTRQRFVAIEFGYPPRDQEAEIVRRESGCSAEDALELAKLGEKVRNLKEHGLAEGVSTRLLIYAGRLMGRGISARRACQTAVVWGLTDETEVQRSIEEVVTSIFPE